LNDGELRYRTEDFTLKDIGKYYVETSSDRNIVEALKSRASVVLQGSRGVGKSFLLRIAQLELENSLGHDRVLPVYVTFNRAGLLQSTDENKFQHWMMAKICNRIIRAARQKGVLTGATSILTSLGPKQSDADIESRLVHVEEAFENSWRKAGEFVGEESNLDPQDLKDAVEDLCSECELERIVLLVDEAAHVFIPQQQREFFTLMRDLRSPQLSIKAAVYPGVTSYGETFQLTHDATRLSVDRDIFEHEYLGAMTALVLKQQGGLSRQLDRYGEVFGALAFAASGNPRILLKTLSRALPLNTNNANRAMKEYYRESVWAEHSSLGERYLGHRQLIDWGRDFLESRVIPEQHSRNLDATETSVAMWINRDAPAAVKEALRLLCYSGILQEAGSGLRATRSGTGSRYLINVGCAAVQDADPVSYCARLRRTASIKRWTEFGVSHPSYRPIARFDLSALDSAQQTALESQLRRDIDYLDLSPFQKAKLHELGFTTVGGVLGAKESDFQTAKWVGEVRSRQMMNAATTAVFEYLSG
jgi:hypothetical protein